MDTTTVTLGGKSFDVPELKLRQLRALSIGIRGKDTDDPAEAETQAFDQAVSVIVAGLSGGYPEITRDVLLDMPITLTELRETAQAILVHAGLVRKPGEGKAGAASIGPTSTIESPTLEAGPTA